ncbi:MAG: SpvB/TcaC N-terminal domain-containing protein [Thermodesulfobacteriota bacterium]
MEQKQEKSGSDSKSHMISPPSISLPKGGGAIRGIGEKFGANPVTGTGSMTVPIATSPGRSGFGPQLALSYDSGSGNGPFGFGWSLSLPSITRKTDKGLPRYRDVEESDEFILSGAEDLVPVLKQQGSDWVPEDVPDRTVGNDTYSIKRYRPRIEGLFARIERWTNKDKPEDTFWRSISKDNITTWYGKTENSRIFDPVDKTHIFSWLICESYDDKGNAIIYEYVPEDSAGIDESHAHERNRTPSTRKANRYLKRIKYGNLPSRLVEPDLSKLNWLFEVVFDYDEKHYENLLQGASGYEFVHAQNKVKGDDSADDRTRAWSVRQDPFSSYRASFEVRTYRLCQRVLMFHHFPAELDGIADYLVRSTEFTYIQSPIASFITTITQSGYKYDKGKGKYLKKSLPPLEFEYSKAVINEDIRAVDAESLKNLPNGLDGTRYQWVDLDGEGLSGILTEQADAWFYKPNLGDGKFGPLETVALRPSLAALSGGRQQLLDLAGDGQLDLVEFNGPVSGFYERTGDQTWESFRTFTSLPNIPWNDANLRFVDLTGDGHADVLVTEESVFTFYPSLAEEGFDKAERVPQAFDEEKGPRLVFADGTQSIYLADLSGDGLTDLVRIRNGEICYWPNLGYGRFGAKVTMDNSPWFDTPDLFDQKRIRLADIDGSGTTDIVYLKHDRIAIYRNDCGNGWSDPEYLKNFPPVDDLSSVIATDLLGNGTACLVWSSALPADHRQPMRYIDLIGGQKPHLLIKTVNNLGAETVVSYASSTKFYLKDKTDGNPWIMRLPFPVHVVERVETYDRVGRNRFVSRYAYHNGYFDGVEREFHGFGMVEQWDTEEFAVLSCTGDLSQATNIDPASHVPPVCTKTWFHTGAYIEGEEISRHFEDEYYREPGTTQQDAEELLLDDTVLPDGLSAEERREACRALKGSILRIEVYGQDGSPKEKDPYTLSERSYAIEWLQPQGTNRHGVFFTHPLETLDYHYERNPHDPRVSHSLTLDVDKYGNVRKSVAIGYGRRPARITLKDEQDKEKQRQSLITYTENDFTGDILTERDDYRTPHLYEARTYELSGVDPATGSQRFRLTDFIDATAANKFAPILALEEIDYEKSTDRNKKQKRLIERIRTLFRRKDLGDALALGEIDSMALPFETYKLVLTPGLLDTYASRILFNDLITVLRNEAGHVDLDGNGNWWVPSGKISYSPESTDTCAQELEEAQAHFFLPRRYQDPFGNSTIVDYDRPTDPVKPRYDLLVVRTLDPLRNEMRVENDYRVLQPRLVIDANGNRTAAVFDTLGLVVGTAVMGKENEPEGRLKGDLLDGVVADLTWQEIDDFFKHGDPHVPAPTLLGKATTRIIYDLDRFKTSGQPCFAATLARETHVSDLAPGENPKIQVSFSYSDGFVREIQKKIQAESGEVDGTLADPRWVGSGWIIFNNKGKPVKQYEPFFTKTHDFEYARQQGVSATMFYDPLERVVATLHPNHTYEKVVFDPWRQKTYDMNDTVASDPRADSDISGYVSEYFNQVAADPRGWETWLQQRGVDPHNPPQNGAGLDPEKRAAVRTLLHFETPTVAHFDSLGRAFLTIADNGKADDGSERKYETRVALDIRGNDLEIKDPRGVSVFKHVFDIAGRKLLADSVDAGLKIILPDISGIPVRLWDASGHQTRIVYDELRRPIEIWVKRPQDSDEFLAGKTVYGERMTDAITGNHRGKVYQGYDGAGLVTNVAFDFKGSLLETNRRLVSGVREQVIWSAFGSKLFDETFASALLANDQIYSAKTSYDALNRVTRNTTPDGSTYIPEYNEANLLESLKVNLKEIDERTGVINTREILFVEDIDYNEKGQRLMVKYGNGVTTSYAYDLETYRLTSLISKKGDGTILQDLSYTYDPVGNIMEIRDNAIKTVYYDQQLIEGVCKYEYDPIYRLIAATGREHQAMSPAHYKKAVALKQSEYLPIPPPLNDSQALQMYTETYQYDPSGNLNQVKHRRGASSNSPVLWARNQEYETDENGNPKSNRLAFSGANSDDPSTGEPRFAFEHDGNGNIITMRHLNKIQWDFKNQMVEADLNLAGDKTYYFYDGAGQRVRKIIDRSGVREERIYLPGYEIYRRHDGTGLRFERKTLHVMDDKNRIALIESRTKDLDNTEAGQSKTRIRYQLGNHLGSAVLEVGETTDANVISYEESYPYGETSFISGRNQVEVSLKRYRYAGKERDDETGLYYYGARYYAPWLGRWTSCDPKGIIDALDLYAFCKNNPVVLIDPNGMQTYYTPDPDEVRTQLEAMHRNPNWDVEHAVLQERSGTALRDVHGGRGSTIPHRGKDVMLGHRHPTTDPTSTPSVGDRTVVRAQAREFTRGAPREHVIESLNDRTLVRVSKSGKVMKTVTFKPNGEVLVGKAKFAPNSPNNPNAGMTDWVEVQKPTPVGKAAAAVERGKAVLSSPMGEFAAQSGGGRGTALLTASKKVAETGAKGVLKVLAGVGTALALYEMGSGAKEIVQGETASGTISVVEGAANLGLSVGVPLAVKGGALIAEGGFLATATATAAGLAAGGSVMLAAETARAAVKGEETPIDVADKFYGTHFGDIYGWVTGVYSKK